MSLIKSKSKSKLIMSMSLVIRSCVQLFNVQCSMFNDSDSDSDSDSVFNLELEYHISLYTLYAQ